MLALFWKLLFNYETDGPNLECERDIVPKYMFDLPSSKLGIYRNAAVVTDAEPCADIGL